jgi:hypothetical protein
MKGDLSPKGSSSPSRTITHPMPSCIEHTCAKCVGILSCMLLSVYQESKFFSRVAWMSGSIFTLIIQLRTLFRPPSKILSAHLCQYFQSCVASSKALHLGQLSVSRFFHSFISFPTPHIPIVCFIIKICRCFSFCFIALPILSQST